MGSKLVTCPETAHVERIEYEEHGLGLLITGCTGLASCAVECQRTCAVMLDRKRAVVGGVDVDEEVTEVAAVGVANR